MRLLFKQRMFSWFDSYDIYDENGEVLYSVEGKPSWGHCLVINNRQGQTVGTIKQKIFSFLPTFDIYRDDVLIGSIHKEFSFFKPVFSIDMKGWEVNGSFLEWDYEVTDASGNSIATVSKELFNWTDTYVIDVTNSADALYVLMLVLAIDAEKCFRD